jgi:hypothetical protein
MYARRHGVRLQQHRLLTRSVDYSHEITQARSVRTYDDTNGGRGNNGVRRRRAALQEMGAGRGGKLMRRNHHTVREK